MLLSVTAKAVWFDEKYVEKGPKEDYESLRQQYFRSLYHGSGDNSHEELTFVNIHSQIL